jgi:hypothetical protein
MYPSYGIVLLAPENTAQQTKEACKSKHENLARYRIFTVVSLPDTVNSFDIISQIFDAMGDTNARRGGIVIVSTDKKSMMVPYYTTEAARAWQIIHPFDVVKVVLGADFEMLDNLIGGSLRGERLEQVIQSTIVPRLQLAEAAGRIQPAVKTPTAPAQA